MTIVSGCEIKQIKVGGLIKLTRGLMNVKHCVTVDKWEINAKSNHTLMAGPSVGLYIGDLDKTAASAPTCVHTFETTV
jgi:hypothetical protein